MSTVISSEVNDTCVENSQYKTSKENYAETELITTEEEYHVDDEDENDDDDDNVEDKDEGETSLEGQEEGLSKTEKWHQFRKDKRFVKSYLEQKIAFGNNYLLIRKVTGKFISMVESQNGFVHEHRRHDMAGAVKYIGYKKSILSRPQTNTNAGIDMSKQSPGYHQQLSNVIDMQDEIRYLIDLMHKQSHCNLAYNIVFNHDVVQINLEDESIINVFFRYDNDVEKLALSHNIDMSNIICAESLQLITFLQKLSTLVIDHTSKAGLEFQNYMSTMYWCQLQLDKLVNRTEEFEVDDTLKADIVQHIEKAKVGDRLSILLGQHVYDDVTYTRVFVIKKLTKVRTIVEVVAQSSEGDIIEFRQTILKISHNITENTERILMIHNALK